MSEKNIFTNNNFFRFFPLIIFMFSPKIDIIAIPGFWQGVRLDDLIIFSYLTYFIFSNKFKIFPNLINKKTIGLNWILFFPYVILSIFIGKIYLLNPQLVIAIRYLEYIALIIILNEINPNKEKILLLFKIYIVLNFIVIILQHFEFIGGFTSRGNCMSHIGDMESYCFDKEDIVNVCFFSCDLGFNKNYVLPGNFYWDRVPGITGGVWELSINLAICVYALVIFEKKLNKILPYILLTLIMLIQAQSRGIIFGFIAGSIFLIKDYKKVFRIVIFSSILLLLIYIFDFFNFRETVHDRFLIDYIKLIQIVFGAFTDSLPPKEDFVGTGLESMWIRAFDWQRSISDLSKSYVLTIFGTGGGDLIYTESFMIRVISSFGILGSLLVIYLSRNLPLFFIIFLLVTGLTIDMFISFKIFVFSFLLIMILKKENKIRI